MKIFVSSTYEDLKDERKEAIDILDRIGKAIAMEKFFASSHPPKDVCLRHLQECDAVVLILGFRYGSIDEAEGISLTEIEYNTAKALGLPVLVFQKRQPDGSWESEEADRTRSRKINSFKSRLDAEKYRVPFVIPQQLATEILGAIREYEIENGLIGARLSALVSSEDFFDSFLDESKLFNHVHPLVGRKDLLEQLDTFVRSNKRVALLYGRGGIGKSKVLFEFGREFQARHDEWRLGFLREGIKLSDRTVQQLPAGKCILAVDDAHRREDLCTLFAVSQQYPDRIKLILTCRPQGLDYLKTVLTRGGFDSREIENIPEIEDLELSDLEKLGSAVLGKEHQRFLKPLVQVAEDSPLVVVIGGRLVAEDAIDPGMLERHSEFRRAVFDRFRDVLVGQVSDRLGPRFCRNLLSLISALAPIQPQTERFQEHVSKFLEVESVELIDAIGILENAGVLLRRGYSLRITPDVLSDHVLHNACVTPQGQPTGYAQKVFEAFGQIFPENVLSNLAELDWRVTRGGEPTDLLDRVWKAIDNEFKDSSHLQRLQILSHLERVAYFQPARSLGLVEYAIRHPSRTPADREEVCAPQISHTDVLRAVPPILKGIAYNLDYLPRCCDILWHLGRDDKRPTSQNPDHAIRVLSSLAGYDVDRPISVNSTILDAIEKWLKESDAHQHIHSPLDVLDPLLAKEGDSARSRGHSVVFRPFAVSFETTKPLRQRAISLLSDCTKSESTKVVLRAMESLIDALNPPRGLFDRVVSDDEIHKWLPEQMAILKVIENLVKHTRNPIVHIQISSDLQWHAKRSTQKALARKAESILGTVPDSFDLRLARAIWNRYDRDWDGKDYAEYQEQFEEEVHKTVNEFLDMFSDGRKTFDSLSAILSHLQDCAIQAQPDYFLRSLGATDSKLCIEICKHIVSHRSSPLSIHLDSLLSGIRDESPTEAVELIELAVETGDKTLCHSIAHGYAWKGWASEMETDEIGVIRTLLTHPDRSVTRQSIRALGRFPVDRRDEAIQLALSVDIDDDEELADTFCEILEPKYGIPPEQLTEEDLVAILAKLTGVKTLDNRLYHLDRFLGYCSSRTPERVVDLLLKRLDIAEEKTKTSYGEYQPLPYTGFHHGLKDISSSPNYAVLLKKVRDRALNPTASDCFWLPKVFAEVSDDFSSTSLEVLREWVEADDAKKTQGVGLLVSDAPSGFIFSHSRFVSELLEKSYLVGTDCYRSVERDLFSSAISGMRSGPSGEPMPQDVELRDQAKESTQKYPVGSPTHRFYFSLMEYAEASIRDSLARDEEIL